MNKVKNRIISSKKYLRNVYIKAKKEWDEIYRNYVNNSLSTEEKLAIVHPINYREKLDKSEILRKRNFAQEPVSQSMECQSKVIWGYKCDIQNQLSNDIQADHLFPYSLGGPTLPSNKIHLCSEHNYLKGSDVHFFPWEEGEPEWLDGTISNINDKIKY
jgi:hypothetical protein